MSEFHRLTDVWGDNSGTVFVGRVDGSYAPYIDPERVTLTTKNGFGTVTQQNPLSQTPGISELLFQAQTKFLNFLRNKK